MKKDSILKEEIEEHQPNKQLTSAELADLFSNFMGDSMFSCVFEHYLQVVHDDEVKDYVEFALVLSRRHVQEIGNIFKTENIPVPVGFGEQEMLLVSSVISSWSFILLKWPVPHYYFMEMLFQMLLVKTLSII